MLLSSTSAREEKKQEAILASPALPGTPLVSIRQSAKFPDND